LYQSTHEEGRIIDGQYEFNIKDHLGNLRVAFRDSLGVAKITQSNAYGVWGEDLPTLSYLRPSWQKDFFKFTGKEELQETGYTDFGARLYDNLVPRFITVDPLAQKYPSLSPYCFVANNPIRYIDPDGREIVDPQGRRAIYYDKKGGMHFTKHATADIRRVANALSLTAEGASQLKRINQSDIKTKINVSADAKIETKDGKTSYTYGETVQGNYNEKDNYGKKVNADGTYGIKEATITIYEGTIKEGVKDGSGLKHEGLSVEQAIGAVAGHEGIHATDKAEINKDLKAEMKGKTHTEREHKPNVVEQKIIYQSKKQNE
jgi:RHS repeat-associated protein